MTDRAIGWAIVGCGRAAERRIAPAIKRASGASLIGFCSRDLIKAGTYAGRHDAPRAFASIEEVLHEDDVTAVYLATPNAVHAEEAVACLKGGRHVLVDKPMALSVAECQRMLKTAEAAKRTLGVMHQQRFHPAHVHAIRMLDEGTLGALRAVKARIGIWYPPATGGDGRVPVWRLDPGISGGGALMDLGPHALDMMLQIGGPVARVWGWCGNLRFNYAVEDFCQARLEFKGGAIGFLDASYCAHGYGGHLEVHGSEGTFVAEGSLQQGESYSTAQRLGSAAAPVETRVANDQDTFTAAIEDFGDAICERRAPTVTAADGLAVMEVIEAIYASARSGSAVAVGA